jgi:hypothetical protein
MKQNYRTIERIVFWMCLIVTLTVYTAAVWNHGYEWGQDAPKVCAKIPGKVAVSSTADKCFYITGVMGKHYWIRRAI